jgi:hypothetical protein
MMTKVNRLADLMIETLTQAGVRTIYGVVGDSLNGLRNPRSSRLRNPGQLRRARATAKPPPCEGVKFERRLTVGLAGDFWEIPVTEGGF